MDRIILTGFNIKINVSDSGLFIKNGTCFRENEEEKNYFLAPNQKKITAILIYGSNGYISLEALKWVSLQNIQLNIFKWDGSLISSLNTEKEGNGKRKIAQYKAYIDEERRFCIAQRLIKAKLANSIKLLEFLPFPNIDKKALDYYLSYANNSKNVAEL